MNAIDYALTNEYGVGKIKLRALRDKFVKMIDNEPSNRGAASIIESELEDKFPGIKDGFPLDNWKQKERLPNGHYKTIVTSKSWADALNTYTKSILGSVNKYGKKAQRKANNNLAMQFNLETTVEPKVETVSSETLTLLKAACESGAKSFEYNGCKIQW